MNRFAFHFYLKDSFGGAERRLTRIYNDLCREHETFHCDIVVRGCDKETAINLFKKADCDISYIDRIIAFKSPLLCLLFFLFTNRYKVIQFFSASQFNVAIQRVCKLSRKKNIYTVCGPQEACNRFPEPHMKRVRQQLSSADFVDLLNPTGIPFVSKYAKGKLSITPGTFTDLDLFKPADKEKVIVYAAARLEEAKNPRLFVEGLNICKDTIKEAGYKAYLLGKGEDEEYLRKYIIDHGMQDIIEMVGYEKTSKYIPYASVFLSLQKYENYPSQSLAEAVASGCYTIITDVGDSRKCADESFASFVKNDPKELSQALCRYILMNDEQRNEVIRSARRFAEEHYSIKASKDYFYQLVNDALNK